MVTKIIALQTNVNIFFYFYWLIYFEKKILLTYYFYWKDLPCSNVLFDFQSVGYDVHCSWYIFGLPNFFCYSDFNTLCICLLFKFIISFVAGEMVMNSISIYNRYILPFKIPAKKKFDFIKIESCYKNYSILHLFLTADLSLSIHKSIYLKTKYSITLFQF